MIRFDIRDQGYPLSYGYPCLDTLPSSYQNIAVCVSYSWLICSGSVFLSFSGPLYVQVIQHCFLCSDTIFLSLSGLLSGQVIQHCLLFSGTIFLSFNGFPSNQVIHHSLVVSHTDRYMSTIDKATMCSHNETHIQSTLTACYLLVIPAKLRCKIHIFIIIIKKKQEDQR